MSTENNSTQHTPGPWRIPGANVFRVVAPDAPHRNKPSGACPPYPWAIVAECDPDSQGGEIAAANARLIAAAPDLLEALKGCWLELREHNADYHHLTPKAVLDAVDAAIVKAEGTLATTGSTTGSTDRDPADGGL